MIGSDAEISHKRLLRIAFPMVIANATVPLLGAVDVAVIGQIGLAARLGAVGLGAIILTILYWIFGFLRMSTSGLAAQAQGAGDLAARSAVLLRALLIGAMGCADAAEPAARADFVAGLACGVALI